MDGWMDGEGGIFTLRDQYLGEMMGGGGFSIRREEWGGESRSTFLFYESLLFLPVFFYPRENMASIIK